MNRDLANILSLIDETPSSPKTSSHHFTAYHILHEIAFFNSPTPPAASINGL